MLILDTPIASEEEGVAKNIMTADSYAMLAVVGNLGYVSWQYDTDAGRQTFKATAEEANAYAGSNIKSFADSASQLQSLMQSLRIKWVGVREILQETGTFRIVIRNQSDDRIWDGHVLFLGRRSGGKPRSSECKPHCSAKKRGNIV